MHHTKMYQKNFHRIIIPFALLFCLISFIVIGCQPIREFQSFDQYQGQQSYLQKVPQHDPTRKTVVLVADNRGTEIFDLLAPFYLFNAIGRANVYILAPENKAIILRKGLFILPHDTFTSFDQRGLAPDLIVIPNLSTMEADSLNPEIINWVKTNYQTHTRLLSVCDGAVTAAATGLYDHQPITTHASDFELVSKQFDQPQWVRDVGVTRSGRLYSTAGISHAVDGSLWVIRDMFGDSTAMEVMKKINYPFAESKTDHQSIAISARHKMRILSKVLTTQDPHVGVLLQEGVSEMHLAAVLDTYHRTFPSSIKSYSLDGKPIRSAFGLTLIPTGDLKKKQPDELHVLQPETLDEQALISKGITKRVIRHEAKDSYIFDDLLGKIDDQYGPKFKDVVKVLLDYN